MALSIMQGLERQPMKFFGHRGASFAFPENSEASIRGALTFGADGVEVDVQATEDQQIIVLHDESLHRTAAQWTPECAVSTNEEDYQHLLTTDVNALSLEQIQRVDIGSSKGPEFSSERVITLEYAFQILSETPDKGILVEVKGGDFGTVPILQRVAQRAHIKPSNIHWIGFDLETMVQVKEIFPKQTVLHIAEPWLCSTPEDSEKLIRQAKDRGLDGVDFPADRDAVTSELVSLAHCLGLVVAVWVSEQIPGCDTPECWTAMTERGVDIFTSDLPPSLAPFMEKNSPRTHADKPQSQNADAAEDRSR